MALQVWLPLTGDLTQQGLSGVEVTNNGAVVNNDGKLGKCYQFSNNAIYGDFSGINSMEQMSGSCWVYLTSLSGAQYFFHFGGQGSYPCKFSLDYEGSIRSIINGTEYVSGITLTINTWYHLTVTFDGNIVKWYVNGEEKAFKTVTGTFSASNHFAIGSRTNSSAGTTFAYPLNNGRMNDIRIYDHCLSVKEVKELSKGLVLHYKLNDNYLSKSENLMPNHLEMPLGTSANTSTGTWRLAGTSNMNRSRILISDSPEGKCYGFENTGIQTANDGSCYGIDSFPLTGNTVYTISLWARCINGEGGYAGFCIYNSTEEGGSHTTTLKNYKVTPLLSTGEWVKCWYTFTASAANTRNIYIGIVTEETNVTTQMCCVHIEKVDNTLDNIIYDSSGYNYNGAIINPLNVTQNTSKYNNAVMFNGATSGIKIDNLNISDIINTAVTYSFWIKPDGETGVRSVYFGSYSGISWSIEKTTANKLRLYWNGSPDIAVSNVTISDGIWQHIVITKNGTSDVKVYLNGELKQSFTNTHSNLTFPTTFRIGRDTRSNDNTPYKGLMSDFRIYATALSADDILELYHTAASIDKQGNLFCGEVVE